MIHIDNEHPPPEQQPKRRRMMPDHANKRFSSPAAISFVPHMGLPIPMSTPDLSLSARAHLHTFETACREGNLPAVMAVTLSDARTPELLHHGLMLALAAGHVEITHHLLANGAFIDRRTPVQILSARKPSKSRSSTSSPSTAGRPASSAPCCSRASSLISLC
ncbi:hypothetical protein N7470_009571 [Penicillium chermesinum]|nr:hypothetical protein N7470_009571 [Penicillium chermesinum]